MSAIRHFSRKKIVLAIFGLLLILIVLKIALLWTAQPKVTVDYVTEYNRMTCPQNYDPNKNAADDYQNAFDSFVKMPNSLMTAINRPQFEIPKDVNRNKAIELWQNNYRFRHIDWPSDFNDDSRKVLKEWLAANKQAFDFFKTASHKPYYWIERGSKEDGMEGMSFPELAAFRDLIEAKLWEAKNKSIDGQFNLAFEDIIDCYLAGNQRCERPSLPFEQLQGIDIKERTLNACLCIINRIQFSPQILEELQNLLQSQFKKQPKLPDLEAVRLEFYDKLQRNFVDNGKGTGRLAWKKAKDFTTLCIDQPNPYLACLIGPTRSEMAKKTEEKFAAYKSIINETPWQNYKRDPNYFNRLESCSDCGNFDIEMLFPSPSLRIFHGYFKVKAKTEALLTILAIQRFKAEKEALPSTLNELISNGYLQKLPLDPYSDGPLVYRVDGNNFTLYSVGKNFKDDDGKGWDGRESQTDDIVFWPIDKRF